MAKIIEENKIRPIKQLLHTTLFISQSINNLDDVTREQLTQRPLSHTTPNVLNKSVFSTEADPQYIIPIFYICTYPILWV